MEWLTLLHHACVIWMTGVILCVQFIIYPTFLKIPEQDFVSFHHSHTQRITWIVAPAMLLEAMTAFALLIADQYSLLHLTWGIGIILIFLSTFLFSLPCHHQLQSGKDTEVIHRLIRTNGIRTLVWVSETILIVLFQ